MAPKPAETLTEQQKAQQDVVVASNNARAAYDLFTRGDRDNAARRFAAWYGSLPENANNKDMTEALTKIIASKSDEDRAWAKNSFQNALGSNASGVYESWWGGASQRKDSDLSPEFRAQQIVTASAISGLPMEAVLGGTLTVQPASPNQMARWKAQLGSAMGPYKNSLTRFLQPVPPVDISKAKIPFTARLSDFKDAAAVDRFVKSKPDEARALMARLGVEQDDATITKWADLQKKMIALLP